MARKEVDRGCMKQMTASLYGTVLVQGIEFQSARADCIKCVAREVVNEYFFVDPLFEGSIGCVIKRIRSWSAQIC